VRHLPIEQAWTVAITRPRCDRAASSASASAATRRPARPGSFREIYDFARKEGLRLTAHAGETVGPGIHLERAERSGSRAHRPRPRRRPGPETGGAFCGHANSCGDLASPAICAPGAFGTQPASSQAVTLIRASRYLFILDDPTLFRTDLNNEYLLAHQTFGFTEEELRRLAMNSFEAASCPPKKKILPRRILRPGLVLP